MAVHDDRKDKGAQLLPFSGQLCFAGQVGDMNQSDVGCIGEEGDPGDEGGFLCLENWVMFPG